MNSPSIVINAYNRPKSLSRLLSSLKLADIPESTNLIFSIEFDPHPEVLYQVNEFEWKYLARWSEELEFAPDIL